MGLCCRVCSGCFLVFISLTLDGWGQVKKSKIPARAFFGADYEYAVGYIELQAPIFLSFATGYPLRRGNGELVFGTAKMQAAFMAAVVFPEVVRYSRFNDFVETTSLRVAYTGGGSGVANFSIGHFQQRPSFIEALEDVCKKPRFAGAYKGVFTYATENERAMRSERLIRLQQNTWQLFYLLAAMQYGLFRFADKRFASEKELVAFFASYYNYGLHSTAKEIEDWTKVYAFPMGKSFGGNQYAYAELSCLFWAGEARSIFGIN